jgi:hypothetical protein
VNHWWKLFKLWKNIQTHWKFIYRFTALFTLVGGPELARSTNWVLGVSSYWRTISTGRPAIPCWFHFLLGRAVSSIVMWIGCPWEHDWDFFLIKVSWGWWTRFEMWFGTWIISWRTHFEMWFGTWIISWRNWLWFLTGPGIEPIITYGIVVCITSRFF